MPGLLRGIARTAVIAGTATSVSNRVSRRQHGRWARHDQREQEQQQYVAAPPTPDAAVTTGTDNLLAQLKTLGELRDSGILTDSEFARQKSSILGP